MATTHTHTHPHSINKSINIKKTVKKESKSWLWVLFLGISFMLLGFAAVVSPFYSSLITVFFLSSLLIIGGIVQVFHAFQLKKFNQILFRITIGILYFIAGVALINSPMMGLVAVSAMIGGLLAVEGILKSILAYQLKPTSNWGWVLISGLCSFALAALIFSGFPETALWVIGLFVGINFVFDGASIAILSTLLKSKKAPY